MFKILKNFNGQGMLVQYALTFAIIVAVVTGMTVYFKRVVQSRYAGVRDYSGNQIDAVFNDLTLNLAGSFRRQYEPYYQQTAAEKFTGGAIIDRTQGGVGLGAIQSKEYDGYHTTVKVLSNQLSPRNAD